MPNDIGWGSAVSNLIGWGKPSEDGDNLINEATTDLLETESDEFLLSEVTSVDIAGWGEAYDNSYWGDTVPER